MEKIKGGYKTKKHNNMLKKENLALIAGGVSVSFASLFLGVYATFSAQKFLHAPSAMIWFAMPIMALAIGVAYKAAEQAKSLDHKHAVSNIRAPNEHKTLDGFKH